jgi:hypothetical protein
MLDALDTSMACVIFFIGKLSTYVQRWCGGWEAYRRASIGKGQDHNINKSLPISRVEYDNKTNSTTPKDMEVLSTRVTHPCDSQIPNWSDIPLLMSGLLFMIVNLSLVYNKGRLGRQPRLIQHQAFVVSDILAPPTKNKLPLINNLNPNSTNIASFWWVQVGSSH